MTGSLDQDIQQHGFAIVPDAVDPETITRFCTLIDTARSSSCAEIVANSSGTYGLRNLVDVVPQTAELVRHPAVSGAVQRVLGQNAFMIRSTLFDKTPGANWGVFWHQDLSIAVRKRAEVPGFSAWTRKAGVDCVQPPPELMNRVLAVRIHLDHCTRENGALRVLPGTHRHARLQTADVEQMQQSTTETICELPAGGLLLMRPLLLHASSPMLHHGCRRVIHLEFADFELPEPLEWRYRIPIS